MKKILVSGLEDPTGGKYRTIILSAVPKTYVTFFTSSRNALGILFHVDLVIVCHPMLLRLLYGDKKPDDPDHLKALDAVRGFWRSSNYKCWFYSTTKQTLQRDVNYIMEHFPNGEVKRVESGTEV